MKEKQKKEKKRAEIIIVLDRSGSMSSIHRQTIDGFNMFIDEQQDNGISTRVTLVQFDHEYQMLYEAKKIKKVKPLNESTYVPRGSTALLDAIGQTIKLTRKRFEKQKRGIPDKTIFVIITDGYENSSTIYTKKKVLKKIKKMEQNQSWEFVYLGANQDAIAEASTIGIVKENAMAFADDSNGVFDMFLSLSENMVNNIKLNKNISFTEEQRKKQVRTNEHDSDQQHDLED